MTEQEKDILKKTADSNQGLLSPAEFLNTICQNNHKAGHNLVSLGYIEEIPTIKNQRSYTFYRASAKGRSVLYPIHKKLWYLIKGDTRTIVVASVISIITTLITLLIQSII